jgi:hypothetical protein
MNIRHWTILCSPTFRRNDWRKSQSDNPIWDSNQISTTPNKRYITEQPFCEIHVFNTCTKPSCVLLGTKSTWLYSHLYFSQLPARSSSIWKHKYITTHRLKNTALRNWQTPRLFPGTCNLICSLCRSFPALPFGRHSLLTISCSPYSTYFIYTKLNVNCFFNITIPHIFLCPLSFHSVSSLTLRCQLRMISLETFTSGDVW